MENTNHESRKTRYITASKAKASLAILIAFVLLAAMAFENQSKQDEDQPENVKLTNSAWDAYKKHQYQEAIQYSDRCIRKFKAKADDDQQSLAKAGAPMPPTGSVSKQQKEEIFKHGLLNDVATCFYIKARSFEDLYRQDKDKDATLKQQAQEAYRTTQSYTYARTWDKRGWFWSPAEDTAYRLQDLK
jgi:type IV secretory pathway VirB10-like protein